MSATQGEVSPVRIHLTNITGAGAGAAQLVQSLLPAMEACPGYRIDEIYLPAKGELANYRRHTGGVAPVRYRRFLPNSLSRLLECTLLGHRFDGAAPLLVLGDLPIRCSARQVVLVQNHLLTVAGGTNERKNWLKYAIARLLFRLNCRFAAGLIVQTDSMKNALELTYPRIRGRLHVIPQPAPEWLLSAKLQRRGRSPTSDGKLKLFYPAAYYPHKNHEILSSIQLAGAAAWPVEAMVLTIAATLSPNPQLPWLSCVGVLAPAQVLQHYEQADALVFLSNSESYGFPLIEAMWIGLPIVCPDLPYARTLCGSEAIYFQPDSLSSLRAALEELHSRLGSGWWPDWSARLKCIPRSWNEVASAMLRLTASSR
jgi:glycosyltransferase involved in cell wall biosynthesis